MLRVSIWIYEYQWWNYEQRNVVRNRSDANHNHRNIRIRKICVHVFSPWGSLNRRFDSCDSAQFDSVIYIFYFDKYCSKIHEKRYGQTRTHTHTHTHSRTILGEVSITHIVNRTYLGRVTMSRVRIDIKNRFYVENYPGNMILSRFCIDIVLTSDWCS